MKPVIKRKKAFNQVLAFVVILGVVASVLIKSVPIVWEKMYSIMDKAPQTFNSSDTIVFDKDGNSIR